MRDPSRPVTVMVAATATVVLHCEVQERSDVCMLDMTDHDERRHRGRSRTPMAL